MLTRMEQGSTQTREWLGRLVPGHLDEHEALIAWLNSDEAHAVLARYPLVEYRLEQRGDALKITMSATEPTGMIRFLRWDRVWPPYWEYQGGGRPRMPLPSPASLGDALRVYWRRRGGGGDDRDRD